MRQWLKNEQVTVKELVIAMLDAPHVKLSWKNVDLDRTSDKWDSGQTITEESIRRFVSGESIPQRARLDAISDFLLAEGYLTEYDLGGGTSAYGQMDRISHNLLPQIGAFLNGLNHAQFVRFRDRNSGACLRYLKLPDRAATSPFAELHEISFSRGKDEDREAFRNRVTAGRASTARSWIGLVVPEGGDLASIAFAPVSQDQKGQLPAALKRITRTGKALPLSLKLTGFNQSNNILSNKITKDLITIIENSNILLNVMRASSSYGQHNDDIDIEEIESVLSKYGMESGVAKQIELDRELIAAALEWHEVRMLKALSEGANPNAVDPNTGKSVAHICAISEYYHGLALLYPAAKPVGFGISDEVVMRMCGADQIGDPAEIQRKWRSAIAGFNPFVKDRDGRVPSAYLPRPSKEALDDQSLNQAWDLNSKFETHTRILMAELFVAAQRGISQDEFMADYVSSTLVPAAGGEPYEFGKS
ncbi:hypothetical protein [Stakelama tenebrarum]|uniref:Uncharacterized protein n=1 Tax=Stakelama tenebrarum TaxID=2711215 RepID=A0A6G6Y4E8_9SPHN|nr:hypothetical protein [Sphingosinithalassobacter tenebrarum]QIG79446.1 hypothetical protein G5C33_06365 [Sphingosinithalassobacter tenebrarum]